MGVKKVRVEVRQDAGFKTECRAGKHTVIIDQPAPGGTDLGPTPLDVQLMALGGCLTAIGRIIANQKRLAINGMEISIEGDIDTDGLLGKHSASRTGFSAITAKVKIDSDMTREEKEKFIRSIEKRCPVSENLQNATPVSVSLA